MAVIDMNPYLELDQLARQSVVNYPKKRYLYDKIAVDEGKHFIGIIGPRGAGKTILLKQKAVELPDSFYLSLDTVRDDLFDLVNGLYRDFGKRVFFLDEIHAYSGIDGILKKFYDFLDIRIIFSSSAALAMHRSSYDLSRRVMLYTLDTFSLREYIWFKSDKSYPELDMQQILKAGTFHEFMDASLYFEGFLCGASLPFALEERAVLPLLENILKKIVYDDIPRLHALTIQELAVIRDIVTFISRSAVDGVNYSTVANNLKITKYKSRQYLELLEKAFVIRQVFPEGTNVMQEPKVVMRLPYRLLQRAYTECIGALREDFFVEAMQQAGFAAAYLKSTRGRKTPDYMVKGLPGIVWEIGGPGKGRRQFKDVHAERKIILSHSTLVEKDVRPLFLMGMMGGVHSSR